MRVRNVILPLTALRRLDRVLEPTKEAMLDRHAELGSKVENLDPVLPCASGEQFYNTSKYDFGTVPERSALRQGRPTTVLF